MSERRESAAQQEERERHSSIPLWAYLATLVPLILGLGYAIYLANDAGSAASTANRAIINSQAVIQKRALDTLCRSNRLRDRATIGLLQQFGVKVRLSPEDCVKFSVTGKPRPPAGANSKLPTLAQLRGLPGSAGARGPVGAQGLRGVPGAAGRSIVGPQGPPGASIVGPQGPPGVTPAELSTLAGSLSDLAQRMTAVEAKPVPPAVDLGPIQTSLSRLADRISALEQAAPPAPFDPTALQAAIDALTARVATLEAQVAALTPPPAPVPAGP
jgi:hypothetical protein